MAIARSTQAAIRFGYGLHPAQEPADGPEGVLRQIRDGAATPPPLHGTPMPARVVALEELTRLNRRARQTGDNEPAAAYRRQVRQRAFDEMANRFLRRAITPHGAFERVSAFWADHFAVGSSNASSASLLPDFEDSAIRPHVAGYFADLLVSAVRHPSMLAYLDQVASYGPTSPAGVRAGRGLNENLARELLELHTLGAGGGYTQADVRAAALLLTGYGMNRRTGGFQFFRKRAERGARRVLGRSYGGARPSPEHAEAMMRDLAVHPDTARHVSRKLVVHFVSDAPGPDLVRHVSAAWRRTDGYLPAVYEALVEHPAAWRDFGAKVKRPGELVISTLRATGIELPEVHNMNRAARRRVLGAASRLGQNVFRPPSPAGWPEEADHWITPQGLAARLEFAGKVGHLLAERRALDPRRFADAALADALRDDTAFAVRAAPERWEGFAYAIASPEFNRR